MARLAAVVAAAAPDLPDAAAILSRAATGFADDVAAAMARLAWRELPVSVVPVGNVFRAGPAYLDPFRKALAARSNVPFVIRPPVLSGVGGALLLARRQAGPPDDGFVQRLVASGLAYEGGGA